MSFCHFCYAICFVPGAIFKRGTWYERSKREHTGGQARRHLLPRQPRPIRAKAGLAPLFAPSLAAPPDALLHGVVIAVPMLYTFRLMFCPNVQWKMPFHGFKLTPRKIIWTTWWLNLTYVGILWMMMVADPRLPSSLGART